jgi:hypothetical protein
MPAIAPRTRLSNVVCIAAGCLLLIARAASAQSGQYTVQILQPPPDLPDEGTTTRAFEINSSGQVFGYTINNHVAKPVVWANGVVAQYLTLPAGYDWASDVGHNFINDSGRIVSQVNPQGTGVQPAHLYWDSPDSPQVLPLAPNICGSVAGIPQEAAWGLNNAGHIWWAATTAATSGDGTVASISSFR